MISRTDSHNVADVIFRITQKSLYIIYQFWSGNISLITELF